MPERRIKICGLTRPGDVAAAVQAGAAYIGFVLVPGSPRQIGAAEAAALAAEVPAGIARVALTLDASDEELDRIVANVPLDMLQLHGHESPERVQALKARHGLPVMKALGIAGPEDLAALDLYSGVADQILVDAKPPRAGALPGGNGIAFDWRLLADQTWRCPWMLAGGLNPGNVGDAIRLTGAAQVDVSSGVESAPGIKDPALVRAFIAAALR